MVVSLLRGAILIGLTFFASLAQAAQEPDYLANAFLQNAGQYRRDITYVTALPTHEIYIRRDGRILHSLPLARIGVLASTAWVVVETLDGAVPPLADPNQINTFEGSSAQALDWHEAWPGIDMRLQIVDGRTERVFRVAPGADPAKIALSFEGVRFEADGSGGLLGRAGPGTLSLSAPIAFQETRKGRVPVDVHYALRKNGSLVSFRLGAYDRRLPLTIDPLLQSTYLGYGGQAAVQSMAVDPDTGDIIVSGYKGMNVPNAAGGFQSIDGINHAYIARVDSKLHRVIQATYFGGASGTLVARVAIHPITGEIYVAGRSTGGFPGGGGGAIPAEGGLRDDGFVARFSADLRHLLQTTYTHQSRLQAMPRDMEINATTGDVYVMGQGNTAAFLLRFNRQLTSQLGRVILQGNSFSYASSIAINQGTGDVYAGGYTSATVFPKTAGGAESALVHEGGDGPESYIARFSANLAHLQTTYLQGVTPNQQPHVGKWSPRLAINPASGEVYAAGFAYLTDVPTAGGALSFQGGQNDTIIMRLSPDLTQKRGATYFGGSGFEELGELAFTPDGSQLYITGYTFSTDLAGRAGGAIPSTPPWGGTFVARFSPSLAALNQTSYFNSDGNVNGMAVVVHPSTGDVYIGGRSVSGIPGSLGGLQPYEDGTSSIFGTAFIARFDSTLAGGDDADADAFTFIDQFGVPADSLVTSAPVRVEGITVPVSVSVTNGEFSIDGDLFSATARDVVRGQSIVVRHRSSVSPGTTATTVLNVGARSDSFVSTTASGADSTPVSFTLPARNPVAMNILVESAPVTVSGVTATPAISVVNGEYSIDGGDFKSAAGTVNGGQVVVVRHRSSTTPATSVDSQLTIGGATAVFRSTTDPVDASVHPFQFIDVVNAVPDFDAASDPIIVMGINVPVPVSVVGGEWSTDAIHWTSAPGTVTNMTTIALRAHTGSGNTTVSATLTVGDQSDEWVLSQPQLGDTTPNPINFVNVTGVTDPGYWVFVESNEFTITGVDVPVWININGEYFDPNTGVWQSQGYLTNGTTTRLRAFTSTLAGTVTLIGGKIGTQDISWEVRSAGNDGTPDTFDFVDQTGVATNTVIESNPVTITGIDGLIRLTFVGCEFSVNSGPFSKNAVKITNNTRLVARMTSSANAATTSYCAINIGSIGDSWTVTTAAASGGGSTSSGGSSGSTSSSGGGSTSSSSSSSGSGSSSGGSSSGGSSASGGGGGGGGGSFDLLALIGLAGLTIRRSKPSKARAKSPRCS